MYFHLIVIWAEVKTEVLFLFTWVFAKELVTKNVTDTCDCSQSVRDSFYLIPFLEMLMPKLPEYLNLFIWSIESVQNNSKGVKRFHYQYVWPCHSVRRGSRNPLGRKGSMFTSHVVFEILRFQLAYFSFLCLWWIPDLLINNNSPEMFLIFKQEKIRSRSDWQRSADKAPEFPSHSCGRGKRGWLSLLHSLAFCPWKNALNNREFLKSCKMQQDRLLIKILLSPESI